MVPVKTPCNTTETVSTETVNAFVPTEEFYKENSYCLSGTHKKTGIVTQDHDE